ncbi:GNAT family N-acetyltransferase [Sphingomonas sp. J315]|uniref:GNAT family N-acetyltransferase n=1 Tax=Sphingomonas sp. J315 TaxID=2898433 RepID=UPI0021ADAA7E|nr:GNAT family N-acetyltransferase [Sphingomonas sp. J315]UUX98367.1 GNAT family N-acetyltransferase [Sphingomonas sp. J315]
MSAVLTIDTPTPADAIALDAMAEASWRDTFAHFYKPEDLAAFLDESFGPEGRLIRDLANPAITWAIARLDGTIAGYAKMVPPTLEQAQPTDAQLSQLYVATDWHGRGVAHALMDWAMATARARHAPALLLTVFEENHRAIAFYAKFGFVHVGDYAFPVGRQIDRDLVMRLAL